MRSSGTSRSFFGRHRSDFARRPASAATVSIALLLWLASSPAPLATAGESERPAGAATAPTETPRATQGVYSQNQAKQIEPRRAENPLCLECGVLQRLSTVTSGRAAVSHEVAQPIPAEPARASLSMIYNVDGQPRVAEVSAMQGEPVIDDEPCKTAEVLIEIMERSRKDPLQGTVFEPSAAGAIDDETADDRAMLVRFVRTLERDPGPTWPAARVQGAALEWSSKAPRDATPPSPTAMLREAAQQIDALAERLEDHELYSRADGLRLLADQLRHDARCQRVESAFFRPFDPPHVGDDAAQPSSQLLPERDLELELDAIHRELSRFREAWKLPPLSRNEPGDNINAFRFGGISPQR